MFNLPVNAALLVVLGSGMSLCFAEEEIEVIGEWKGRGVEGHPGVIARWESEWGSVLLAMGRRHLYEGYLPGEIAGLIDAVGSAGLRSVVLANAAGGLNPLLQKGDIVLHRSYIGTLLGGYRLTGKLLSGADEGKRKGEGGDYPLDTEWYRAIRRMGMEKGIAFREGVYAGVLGPSYETRSEIRMLRRMGADLVGMSTVTEVEGAARHGMSVVGFSLVTNTASDTVRAHLVHEEVTETSAVAAARVRAAVESCVHAKAQRELRRKEST